MSGISSLNSQVQWLGFPSKMLNERKKKWRDRESGKLREMEGREGDRERKRKEREMGESVKSIYIMF